VESVRNLNENFKAGKLDIELELSIDT
jgi:hypothetical protein